MKRPSFQMGLGMSLLLVGIFAAAPVLAAPPYGGEPDNFINGPNGKQNNGKIHDNSQGNRGYNHPSSSKGKQGADYRGHDQNRPGPAAVKSSGKPNGKSNVKAHTGKQRYFSDQHRSAIHDYYAVQYRQGHCPPGLIKKSHRCVPPGSARAWTIGRPLPRSVIFYDLPPAVLTQLGPAPAHHRFVRVAQDILLIATGTGMVVDAIDNLSWEFNQ